MMTEEEIRAFLNEEKNEKTTVKKLRFPALTPGGELQGVKTSLKHLEDVPVLITAELGGTNLTMAELLELSPGMLIKLEVQAGEAINLKINQQKFGRGEIIVLNDYLGVRVSSVYKPHSLEYPEENE
ncbi:FliM/FliN family flagellar motor switch protein [Desulfolucanica intricata]|uniref:FliM/FliN family flagellar motor switch protein n=1 Tax=Desulfolucanica intricata TaxID=1285191 RepID=UPI00083674A2|nr:FliM/FliN family flagellar motor switch protein [Desulfolucanica intricata]